MSDTVAVALITFASGLLGALTGAISSYLISKNTDKNERAKLLHTERRESYSAFLHSYHTYTIQVTSSVSLSDETLMELRDNLQTAYVSAALLASDDIADAMDVLMTDAAEMAETRTFSEEYDDIYNQVTEGMKHEVQEGL